MSELVKDLNDACMCGEPFYGRPCLWCKAKEHIAELDTRWDEALAMCQKLKDDNSRLRALLSIARCPNTQCDDGVISHGPDPDVVWQAEQCQWCFEREAALKGDKK